MRRTYPINLPQPWHDVIVEVLIICVVLRRLRLLLHCLLVHLWMLAHVRIIIHLPVIIPTRIGSVGPVTCGRPSNSHAFALKAPEPQLSL